MKHKQHSRLTLNKKTISVLSNAQRQQINGGVKDEESIQSWFRSMIECNTITCCSIPFCSVGPCGEQVEAAPR